MNSNFTQDHAFLLRRTQHQPRDEASRNIDIASPQIGLKLRQHPNIVIRAKELEQELKEPTGANTPTRPPLLMDAILLSRDCGLMIEIDKAEGLRSRLFFRKVTTCEFVYFILTFLIYSLVQMQAFLGLCICSYWYCSLARCHVVVRRQH